VTTLEHVFRDEWGRRTANATGLPIEVRPFQDENGH